MSHNLRSQFLIGLGITAALLFAGTGTAHAQRRDDGCATRIQRDQDAVNEAVNHYGYDSRQAQHERNALQKDAQDCGYSGPSNYNDYNGGYRGEGWDNQGRNDRSRNQDRNYDRGYYDNGQSGYNNPAYDIGYRDGVAMGQKDSQKRKSFRPEKNDQYEDADNGYNKNYGDKNQYKRIYREGFQRGYSDGYRQWR
jgi:hypothetical protein